MKGNPNPKPNPLGRPKGSKNKFSSKQKMFDALEERGFNFFDEWIDLYRSTEKEETKAGLIMRIAEFLFPKLRAVDLDGNAEDGGKEAALGLAKQLTEIMSESRKANR